MIYVSTTCLKGENSKFTKDVFRVLEIYKEYNIKNIELGSVHSYVKKLSKLKKYQKENNANFIIHGFFPPAKKPFYLNFSSKNKNIVKESIKVAKNAIDLCNELNSNLYSTHPGLFADVNMEKNLISEKISFKEAVGISVESFNDICDYASNYNIKVAVENAAGTDKANIFKDHNDFNNFFKKVEAKNLGALIDIGHANIAKVKFGVDVKELINNTKKIFEIHIHQSIGGDDTHLNINSLDLLKDFDKEILKKAELTLEATGLNPNEILKGKEIVEQVLV